MLHAIRSELRQYLLPKVRKVLREVFELDRCHFCRGIKGNTRGNENVIGGFIACDDCSESVRRAADAMYYDGYFTGDTE